MLAALSAPMIQAAHALEQRMVAPIDVEYTGSRRGSSPHPKRRTNAAALKRAARRRRNIRKHGRRSA